MALVSRQEIPEKLDREFFKQPAIKLAPALVGKILVRRVADQEFRARITETEAYIGEHDLACHASKGRTSRTEVMFGPAGHAYVYFIYGMYDMLNIVAADIGDAQAVLIRAAEPLNFDADLRGPGKLARAMHITRRDNGVDLTGDAMFLLADAAYVPRIVRSKRIGVDYARHWKDRLLRFHDAKSKFVSKTAGRRNAV
jgi:DNA-3-methyladenine glycosylase